MEIAKKICPHCGGHMFMAKIIRAGVVESTTNSDEPYKILKESKDADFEILKCAKCRADVKETDLITSIQCKECGKLVNPTDVNEEGICNVCAAIKQRTEIANASREDLIKMLLDAEKKVNPVAVKMEKQIEKAEETTASNTTVTITEEASTEEVSEETTEEVAEEKKPRRKARKKSATTEEIVEETTEEVSQEEEPLNFTDDAVNDIANQQDAPFPDVESMVSKETPQVEETPVVETVEEPVETVQEEQPIGADFRMFDDTEEAF